ncbi:hypothetical protein DAI22_06g143401 [Oryza sativa Japonica Group]|nr:hypothetical protein DAI22_06g143401 [Oryza sativa Japonica Group]
MSAPPRRSDSAPTCSSCTITVVAEAQTRRRMLLRQHRLPRPAAQRPSLSSVPLQPSLSLLQPKSTSPPSFPRRVGFLCTPPARHNAEPGKAVAPDRHTAPNRAAPRRAPTPSHTATRATPRQSGRRLLLTARASPYYQPGRVGDGLPPAPCSQITNALLKTTATQ